MMFWFVSALFGHIANAAAFLVDKMLLSSALKRSGTYAVLMGSVSGLALLAAPFVSVWPDRSLFWVILGFGGFFVCALWAFFEAMRQEEASRIVPIVGTLIPIFTWMGEYFVLGGAFTIRETLGFALLVLATFLFTKGSERRRAVTHSVLGMAVLAALLFALASLCGKYAFDHASFLGVLVLSRVCTFITALGILIVAGSEVRAELRTMFISSTKSPKTRKTPLSFGATAFAIGGQALAGVGFVAVHAAMLQGSAAIVNALQAVQYGVLVIVGWVGGKRLQQILHEDVSTPILLQKGLGILVAALGLWCLAAV